MSLRVWLSLTKDLRNQGLDDIAVTNSGATFDSVGKLGGCYSFDGTDDAITVGNLSTLVTDKFSFACWFYHDDTWSSKNYETIFGGPSGFELETKSGSTNSPVIRAYSWGQGTFTYELNKWNHLVMTRTTSETKFYLNGELKLTGAAGTIPSGNYFVGSWSTTTGQNFKGKVNDVRIYDHCLSPMEVKELSKGLVLHYPLNHSGFGQENFILESHQVTSGSQAAGITRTYEDDGTVKFVAASGNNNYATVFFAKDSKANVGEKLSVGDVYTISCDIKVEAGNKLPTLFINGGNGYKQLQGTIILGKWIRAYYTSTWAEPGTQYGNITLHLGFANAIGTYYFKNFKLEKSSVPTPWTPAPTDELYTILGLNSNIEYDTSGYCNNGTRTGTFSWTSDTPKYSISTKFNGAEKISANSLPSEVQSVSFWVKVSTIPSGYEICYVDSNTQTSIGFYNGNSFITSCAVSANVVLLGTTFKANEWNHIVLVKTGANTRNVYCNGILLTNSGTNSWVHNGSNLSLGWRDYASGNAGWFNGQLCDFRAYATALSADDVKSLYQNSAYIDSSGNVYGTIHES